MHKCKLCFRTFSNGRALGGHMRSHMMNLAKQEEESSRTIQLSFEAESAQSSSSSSSSSEDDNDDNHNKALKNNPMSIVDPEFSGSVILQDRESETESSKNNPTRRRSKRVWKIGTFDRNYNTKQVHQDRESALIKKGKFDEQPSKTESWIEHEPLSSISDATTEEDVAFCLMMMSRDKWETQNNQQQSLEEEDDDDDNEEEEDDDNNDNDDSDEFEEHVKVSNNRLRKGMYKCETCNKVFRSYQALGGHRASHKKIRVNIIKVDEVEIEGGIVEKKIHECPVCFRIFASGQALGGHKRTHVNGSTTTTTIPVLSSMKIGKSLIDLNLPAPIDDDDDSQIENSAVSDAEFVKTH